jgi:hypothetical protein
MFALGNIVTVDESMWAYSGADLRAGGNDAFIPRKPHPYGLLVHGVLQITILLNLPVILDWEIRLPTRKFSPVACLVSMVSRLERDSTRSGFHVIADSGFPTSKLLQQTTGMKSVITTSVSASSSSGYVQLYAAVTCRLDPSSARTFVNSDGRVVQVHHAEQHTTVLMSNAFRVKEDGPIHPPLQQRCVAMTYEQALWLYSLSAAQLVQWFSIPAEVALDCDSSKLKLIKYLSGMDITLPAPDPETGEAEITAKTLTDMTLWQLKLLEQRTAGQTHATGTNKTPSKHDFATQLPGRMADAGIQTIPSKKRERLVDEHEELELMVTRFCGQNSTTYTVYDRYAASYGWQDHFNRRYYESFSPKHCRNASKLCVMSLVVWMSMNSYCGREEAMQRRSIDKANGSMKAATLKTSETYFEFLFKYAETLLEQK